MLFFVCCTPAVLLLLLPLLLLLLQLHKKTADASPILFIYSRFLKPQH
jgi:hypothetical protein